MTTLTALTDRLRLELGDPLRTFVAEIETDGSTTRFTLPVDLVDETGFSSYLASAPGTPLVVDTDFTMDYRDGVLDFASAPAADETLVIKGSYSETFLTAELQTFIDTAFLQHAHNRTSNVYGDALTYEDLPGVEDYLVVILAEIEALWAMATDAAQEIDVRNPDGVNIPVGQRYEQLLGLIAAKRAQYEELAQQLNVGLNRLQMYTLRRVSRTTNRLVPVYVPQEYDDTAPPVRVYPPIDPQVN